MNLIDLLTPQIAGATDAAIDAATARPLSVVLSVDTETKAWIDRAMTMGAVSAIIIAVVAGLILRRMK